MTNLNQQLAEFEEVEVTQYLKYINSLKSEKDKRTNAYKNQWAIKAPDDVFVALFKQAKKLGVVLDGKDVLIKYQGGIKLDFTYQAYKNLVLDKYPETTFDIQLIFEGDEFEFYKENGKIKYRHKMLGQLKGAQVIGGYAIIKNKSGEYLEQMHYAEMMKIRSKAKTTVIWDEWLTEMCYKTLVKRICKRCMYNVTREIDEIDNEDYDLELTPQERENIDRIKQATTIEGLRLIWADNQLNTNPDLYLPLIEERKNILRG